MGKNCILRCFSAEVLDVHSGDDLIVLADLGMDGLYKKVRVRLKGVDTPDAYHSGPETEAGKIREYVKQLVKGKKVFMEVHNIVKHGTNWVVTIYLGDDSNSQSLNAMLIDMGYVFITE